MTSLHYIAGPPGTGKTTYLQTQARRAAEARGGHTVAIASLTRTAAAEIGGRDTGVPDENIGTLHAHAYRSLDRPDLAETPEGLAEWNAEHPAARIRPSGQDAAPTDTRGDATGLHARVMAHRARMTPETGWTAAERAHQERWQDYKHQTGRWDFADLIEHATGVSHHLYPSVWLIDEAQDLSRLELALALSWIRRADTGVLVGDAQQALYTWRGADPHALRALPYDTRRGLEQSYRVPRAVQRAALTWIGRQSTPIDSQYHARDADGSVTRLRASTRDPHTIALVAQQHAAQGREVMILGTCRHHVAPVLGALRDVGEPYHNPHRAKDRTWNPLRAADGLAQYICGYTSGSPWTWAQIASWAADIDARRWLEVGARSIIEHRITPDQDGRSDAEKAVSAGQLAEILGAGPAHPALRGDLDWYQAALKHSRRGELAVALSYARRHGAAVFAGPPSVVVGTAHSVKGAAADVVILIPDVSPSAWQQSWTAGHRTARRDALVRLGYVALTRARDSVLICDAAGPLALPLGALAGATDDGGM